MIQLNPPFDSTAAECLNKRKKYIAGRELDFNYRRYAYIYLTSKKSDSKSIEDDTTSLFDTYPKKEIVIGQVPKGGHLDLYDNENGIRRLIPQITSVSINQDGGGDIYNSYIREVEIQFKVYSLAQLEKVEENFFRLGSECKINYGWLDPINTAETGEIFMSVYNFGFSMNSDGSFDCNIKGLAGDVFPGANRMGGLLKLADGEEKALGEKDSNPADISMALMAKYKTAFGLDADENASDSGIKDGELKVAKDKSKKIDLFMAGIMNVGESESSIPFMGDDPIRTPFTNLKSLVFLANQLSGGEKNETFTITTDEKFKKISPAKKTLGSADPRKFILPGLFSDYGEGIEYESEISDKLEIGEILISIDVISQIVKGKGTTVNDQFQPPKVVDVFQDLSKRLSEATGGLVQLDIKPDTKGNDVTSTSSGKYLILNKTEMLKTHVKESKDPFQFKTIGEESMVRDISIDTEFDADIMLYMTVGNVKNGNIKLETIKGTYPRIPPIEPDPPKKDAVEKAKKENPTKASIGKDGIDDTKANALAATMQKILASEEAEDSPQAILPFQLKLGVTLDGIEKINFLAPVTADRLPGRFRNNVKFLVTGVEHSFDGQGGWTTSLKTVMTMKKN